MKTLKMLSTAFTVMLAILSVTATTAGAFKLNRWLLNGSPITSRTADESGLSFMTFENTAEGYTMTCSYWTQGDIINGGQDEITSVKSEAGGNVIPCSLYRSSIYCKSSATIEATGLPWTASLTLEGEIRNGIGVPANWKVRCQNALGGEQVNNCSAATSALVTNFVGGVEETYEGKSPKTTCANDASNHFGISGVEKLRTRTGTLSVE